MNRAGKSGQAFCFHCTRVSLISKPRHLLVCRKAVVPRRLLVCRKALTRHLLGTNYANLPLKDYSPPGTMIALGPSDVTIYNLFN